MPTYVYGCKNKHRQEIAHSFFDRVVVFCGVCHERSKRIPQIPRFYINPQDVLLDRLDKEYRQMRGRERMKQAH